MSGWGGFTEDDLRRMKQNIKSDSPTERQGNVSARKTRPTPRSQARSTQQSTRGSQPSLPPEQRLAPPPQEPVQPKENTQRSSVKPKHNLAAAERTSVNDTGTGQIDQSKQKKIEETENAATKETEKEGKAIIDDEEILNLEMTNLDKFRSQQKQIEELNKKKRQILASAIFERQKKAKAESVKLTRIQKELERLDQLLTVDVSLIRDRIEESSRHYMEAQKRFDKAEKEYIASKMELFNAQEMKEQLTEHLYTVIQQNELRKAQKLKELMDKLEMESADSDNSDVSDFIQSMKTPSLTVLNAMATTQRVGSHVTGSHVTSPTQTKGPACLEKPDKGEISAHLQTQGDTSNVISNTTESQPDSNSKIAQSNESIKAAPTQFLDNPSTQDAPDTPPTSQTVPSLNSSKQTQLGTTEISESQAGAANNEQQSGDQSNEPTATLAHNDDATKTDKQLNVDAQMTSSQNSQETTVESSNGNQRQTDQQSSAT